MPFQRFRDPETNRNFLYNPVTGETKWETPGPVIPPGGGSLSPAATSSKMSAVSPLPHQSAVSPSMYDSDGGGESGTNQAEGEDDDDASSSNGGER